MLLSTAGGAYSLSTATPVVEGLAGLLRPLFNSRCLSPSAALLLCHLQLVAGAALTTSTSLHRDLCLPYDVSALDAHLRKMVGEAASGVRVPPVAHVGTLLRVPGVAEEASAPGKRGRSEAPSGPSQKRFAAPALVEEDDAFVEEFLPPRALPSASVARSMPTGGGGRPKLGISGSESSLGYTSSLPATILIAAATAGTAGTAGTAQSQFTVQR